MVNDLAYSFRSLLKHRGFTVVAVLTLALGIGVNAALFTVFDAFVLKPLPLKDPDSLVAFDGADAKGQRLRLFSYSDGVGCGLLVGVAITRLFAAVLIDLSSLDPLWSTRQ
jgi:hypothetical protein